MPLDPEKIRSLLAAKKLTQTDLANQTGIARPNIGRILSGDRTDPNLSTAERIAEALGCSLKSIIS